MIELYVRNQCGNCDDVKQMLNSRLIPYTTYTIDNGISREQVLAKFPNAKVLPLVVVDGDYIGSTDQLNKYLDNSDIKRKAIVNILNNAVGVVEFTKKNGEVRVIRGTRNPDRIPSDSLASGSGENTKPDSIIAVFDLDINQWRSFRVDSVIDYKVDGKDNG